VLVSKAGAYIEIDQGILRVSKYGVYVEIGNTAIRTSKAGAYAELLPPDTKFVTGQDGLHVYYNGQILDDYIVSFVLESAIKANIAASFNDEDAQQPSLAAWVATLNGMWERALDDIFGAEVAGRGSSSTMYNFKVQVGRWNYVVGYTWLQTAFVSNYKVHMNIDDAMVFDATIALSGPPERGSNA
jgi:hypothetical protein